MDRKETCTAADLGPDKDKIYFNEAFSGSYHGAVNAVNAHQSTTGTITQHALETVSGQRHELIQRRHC
jgi:hypothetical protein